MAAGGEPEFPVILRGKSVQTYPDLLSAGEHYIKEYFNDWLARRLVSIVPPIPWIAYNRVLGPPLKETEASRMPKLRGDNAELMVYKNVYLCGEKFCEPMFLIAQMDYDPDNKTKQFTSLLTSFLPKAKLQQLELASRKMDIDLLIIHAEIGVVVVEIKAAVNPLVEIGATTASLRKAENILRLFCNEDFPIYKLAAFINCESLNEGQRAEIQRLEAKDGFTLCDKAFVVHPEEVQRILGGFKARTRVKGYPNLIEQADNLLYWVISLKCLVSSVVRDRKIAKVTLTDDAVNVVKQIKQTDAKLVQHDVYSKAEQKSKLIKKVKNANEILYLNPEQIAVWDGPQRQSIRGVAGTGKTVLIQHKVLELDRILPPEEEIIVIATDGVSKVYSKFFELNKVTSRVQVLNFANVVWHMHQGTLDQFCVHHLFIDEAQNVMTSASAPALWTAFSSALGRNKGVLKYLWISLDPIQVIDKMTISIEEIEARVHISCIQPLQHVMRCTPEVTSYWSQQLPADCPVKYDQGNRLFVQDIPIYHATDNSQAVDIVSRLLERYVDGENIGYKDCAVLLHSPPTSIIPIRKGLLEKLGWRDEASYFLSAAMDDENIVIRDMPNDIWSLEWCYVFLVAQDADLFPTEKVLDARLNKKGYWNSGIYIASSRCKVQLFLISLEKGKQLNVDLPVIDLAELPPDRVKISVNFRS